MVGAASECIIVSRWDIFGAGPLLQTLAANKCPKLNTVQCLQQKLFERLIHILYSLSHSKIKIKKTNKKEKTTNIN